ncbi:FadR/GntR family transcriptional regulator [Umezawaea sp. Da 62-37]|uniref:FadR/GntR family transcriptional regulator n=1 Tax=Umezawaea sp. Da 62-37 TaxID=3075927 RepID=UPI0028F71F7A|nr:FadR/GntR family transcriptional regulator [Umezawaea sp. Da 62-37]WNV82714.1 FadR/GntR family transcriptional regulator [Umezawaea sp. Da 62-37]
MSAEQAESGAKGDDWALSADSRRPLPDVIADKLSDQISTEYSVGDRLPTEPELATRMGVARSSLRTALQRLQIKGIVEVKRGLGWYVLSTNTSPAEEPLAGLDVRRYRAADLLEMRIALETTAASMAALRADQGELDEIAKLNAKHREVSHSDKHELLRTDEAFHGAIVRASRNEMFEHSYQSLEPQLRDFRWNGYANRELHNRSVAEHDQIVWFIRRHDQAGARAAMTTHLLGLYNDLGADADATLDTYAGAGGDDDEPEWHRGT